SQEPHLKKIAYDQCFVEEVDGIPITKMNEDIIALFNDIKAVESYEKWDKAFIEQASPIINEWRAKIPDLKANLIEVVELEKKNRAEAEALKAKQKEEADRQAKE